MKIIDRQTLVYFGEAIAVPTGIKWIVTEADGSIYGLAEKPSDRSCDINGAPYFCQTEKRLGPWVYLGKWDGPFNSQNSLKSVNKLSTWIKPLFFDELGYLADDALMESIEHHIETYRPVALDRVKMFGFLAAKTLVNELGHNGITLESGAGSTILVQVSRKGAKS